MVKRIQEEQINEADKKIVNLTNSRGVKAEDLKNKPDDPTLKIVKDIIVQEFVTLASSLLYLKSLFKPFT